MKRLVVIAGPHGAGKTKFMVGALGRDIIRGKSVDPQHVYETLQNHYAIETYNREARPDFVQRAMERAFTIRYERIRDGKSVTAICSLGAIEDLDFIEAARRNAYHISLYFFGVSSWRICETYIRSQKKHWLHKLDSRAIYGDYHRALAMLPGAILLSDTGRIYDNADPKNPTPLLGIEEGRITIIEKNLPDWILEPLSRCL